MHHLFIYSSLAIDLQGSSLMPLFFLLSGYSLTVAYSTSGASSYIRVANTETENHTTDGLIVDHGGEGSSSLSVSVVEAVKLDHNESEMVTENGNIQACCRDVEESGRTVFTTAVHDTADAREILLNASSSSSSSSPSSWDQFQRNLRFWNNRFVRVYPLYLLTSLFALPFWLYGYGDVSPLNTPAIVVTSITTVLSLNSSFLFLLGGSLSGPGWTIGTLMVGNLPLIQ